MSTEQLKESLKKLHENLNGTDQVDAELSALLTVLSQDIHQLLSKERPEEDSLSNLGDRTLALSAKFAAQNPHLELGLRELGDILARMGI
ncbi:DUF4404 family protein [Solimicrobium silvestre]|uniref:DUF4404 domain-containing protein n=1 Tax=Solimicrobium silvestre TaxID=2099400 RepID=A0A2S9GY15_9BURK|nr:DUF4404 family protein [Solimicrobium silvestre]PRC92601.1 hypothetical protein S2091_2656 [Solimicrobium silvestre]